MKCYGQTLHIMSFFVSFFADTAVFLSLYKPTISLSLTSILSKIKAVKFQMFAWTDRGIV